MQDNPIHFHIPITVMIHKVGLNSSSRALCFAGAILLSVARLFPSSVSHTNIRYPRYELQKQNTIFYRIECISSGIGGLLTYRLMRMEGQTGISG
ncbi:hypothetical protein N7465_011231 [Penicillium sp. CMV-2018d]|nr:hypothetical protein N7465_011231 [Penicillium sp. CMV-2018d]